MKSLYTYESSENIDKDAVSIKIKSEYTSNPSINDKYINDVELKELTEDQITRYGDISTMSIVDLYKHVMDRGGK